MADGNQIEEFKLTKILNGFSLKLFNKLSKSNSDNLVISPFSVFTCLSMCYAGAKNNTASQLKHLLNLNELTDDEILELNNQYLSSIDLIQEPISEMTIKTANKIYPNHGFEMNKNFVDQIEKFYQSQVEQLDFKNSAESAKKINDWILDKTYQKIKDVVSGEDFDEETRLVLVNAIHFKARWMLVFDESLTTKDNFHLKDGTIKSVDMMRINEEIFRILINPLGLKASVCEIPYNYSKASFTIILPDEGTKLEDIEENLTSNVLEEIIKQDFNTRLTNLHLPKFNFENKTELCGTFEELGADHPFDPRKSDFSAINDKEKLFISKVIHQTMIDVNEHGTEAAAVTAAVMKIECLNMDDPYEFKCNRPFLFLIHENSKNGILFVGKVVSP